MSLIVPSEISNDGQRTVDAFAVIGMIVVIIIVLNFLWKAVLLVWYYGISRICKTNLEKKYGGWAVVTGSTDGIGKAYAQELAKRGFNIVLIARNRHKLQKVAQKLIDTDKVQAEFIVADFSGGRPIYDTIAQGLRGKDIGILVNNVGVLGYPKDFEQLSEDEIWNQILVNVASVPAMTKIVLHGMLERKRGLIVNISSTLSAVPFPYFQVYAASKAFVRSFSVALAHEYRGTGVDVQTVLPGAVATNLLAWNEDDKPKPSLTVPIPHVFARDAVATIGYAKETAGYWPHEIQLMALRALPEYLVTTMAITLVP
ncbi:inactive hydroxysteroid dehydrogenase-like protein 1 [Macrobrachium rosenbergii]|uniref:inactive hydroxysteroid dehydrogenase-like protein 1 n=1 Tax=Macrobrachium rosenbergii TaxID=79674 RepID=UPI0034D579F9